MWLSNANHELSFNTASRYMATLWPYLTFRDKRDGPLFIVPWTSNMIYTYSKAHGAHLGPANRWDITGLKWLHIPGSLQKLLLAKSYHSLWVQGRSPTKLLVAQDKDGWGDGAQCAASLSTNIYCHNTDQMATQDIEGGKRQDVEGSKKGQIKNRIPTFLVNWWLSKHYHTLWVFTGHLSWVIHSGNRQTVVNADMFSVPWTSHIARMQNSPGNLGITNFFLNVYNWF